MGLYASFDVIDDFGFLEATEEWNIRPDYSAGCAAFADTFVAVATALVPVDTGYLQSTINADGGETFCECSADAEYAQYVEYGTWKMSAQPYFEPALEAALSAAEPLWVAAEEEAILEDEMLSEEEEAEQEAMMERAQGGGVDYSSFQAFLGTILATFIVALIITTIQAMFGHDFTSHSSSGRGRHGDDGGGAVYMPDVIIT